MKQSTVTLRDAKRAAKLVRDSRGSDELALNSVRGRALRERYVGEIVHASGHRSSVGRKENRPVSAKPAVRHKKTAANKK